MNYYVYLLVSNKDGFWYTGFTHDLKNRLSEHRAGKVFSTKNRLPIQLVYYEVCKSDKDARLREKYLKSGVGKRYLRNRLKYFFTVEQLPNQVLL